MPLTDCPDCGAQISDLAPACNKCGRPMTDEVVTTQQTGKPYKTLQAFGVITILLGFVACSASDGNEMTGLILAIGAIMLLSGWIGAWWSHG
jgi:protein-S-isoprenylcysteine O-methyltransferase Ste14